jgi:putative transposase
MASDFEKGEHSEQNSFFISLSLLFTDLMLSLDGRIYKKMGMPLRRKTKKRLPARVKEPLGVPGKFTHTWSIGFVGDVLSNGVKLRSFNVIDDYNREVLFIETDYSLKSSRVIWVLKHLVNRYGKPENIRMDNGPEFIVKIAQNWSKINGETHSKRLSG